MMDTILRIIESEAGLTVIAALVGMAWAAFRASAWYRERVSDNEIKAWQKAVDCVTAGVNVAYEEYVRGIKAGNADGKLTEDERKTARKKAFDAAIEYAKDAGISLFDAIGSEAGIHNAVQDAVMAAKQGE